MFKILKQSIFTINFINAKNDKENFSIFNNRFIESIYCNTLVFSKTSIEIEKFFIPNKHFITYKNQIDLIKKINYYKKNKILREKIINNANERLYKIFNKERVKKFFKE
jgi:spore maturation protein CgeB